MKLTFFICVFFALFAVTAFAQNNFTIKGTIADSAEKIKLGTAAVIVLQAKDSIQVKFGYAKSDGTFMLDGLSKGKYLLLVAYPDYADYGELFSLDSANTAHDFGNISMSLKSRLLREVIIKGTASQMKIKGDTTEFNAKAFVIQPNASVEDLLKQLPGITVDKDGKITAEGQAVTKVLLDGEEFFGDDPTLVTRNIRADMVDKIQLYDKKSDQAAFTGVDDGKTEKTVNVKLKANNQGVFGKFQAGDGPEGIYQGEALLNIFKNKEKFSVFGTIGNNGKVGIGWEDEQKYGMGDQLDFTDNGININTQSSDDLDVFTGIYSGKGFPLAQTAGAHYDNKWNDDKQFVNANYKVGYISIDGSNDVLTQNNIPGNIFNSNSDENSHNNMFRQKLSVVFENKLDTASSLKISVDGTLKHIITDNDYTSADTLNHALVNNATRQINNTVDQRAFNASAFYTHKFHKPGRTLSFLLSEEYSQNQANGLLISHVNFYNTQQQVDSTQDINQSKTNNLQSNLFNTNLTYSEPFTTEWTLVLNYGIGVNHASADRNTFNPSSTGAYNILVDSLSSDYTFNQFLNHAGAILSYKKGKLTFNFGTRVTGDQFQQIDNFTGNLNNRTFIDWAPQARLQYRFAPQKSFTIAYNGTTTQPTLEQLQPVASNSDPLNIIVGNPGLTPSFTNTFNLNYRSYKVLASQFFGVFCTYSVVTNPIVNHINYNTVGQSVSQYFNLPGRATTNLNAGFNFGRKFDSLDGIDAGLGFNVTGNTSYNYTNDSLNKSRNYVFSPAVTVGMVKMKKVELRLNVGPTYTISGTSLQPNVNNNGWGALGTIDGTVYLPGKFQLGTFSQYQYNAATASFNNDFNQFLLTLFISKTFLKDNNLMVELWGNDLLNQNSGFTRIAQANLVTQTTNNTLKRYFMLTIDYNFTKMAVGTSKQ